MRGKALLYAYCQARGVAHRRCGKLLVATSEHEVPKLHALHASAAASGVTDLSWLSAGEARAMEPALLCVAALWSPSSGIVDSHALMTALLGDAEAAGAALGLVSPVRGAQRDGDGWVVRLGADSPLHTRWLINAAGLAAQALALNMQGFAPARVPALRLAKGHYFALQGHAPFSRLIYPLPADRGLGGLGVHLTLDLGGQAKFGPDVQWLPEDALPEYSVDAARADAFYAEIRRYWPALPDGALVPAYAGIRPKLSSPGEPAADFHIAGPAEHGAAGAVQLFGIESPGLTAALAIGEHVAGIVDHERA